MQLNVPGRVRNVSLPASKPLFPLFEAIINSIQAIEDGKSTNGRIDIHVVRDDKTFLGDEAKRMGDITGFKIADNGIGFNSDNYEQFNTGDTQHKLARGGKGVGRFLWLKAFERVEVESTYRVGQSFEHRAFEFTASNNPIKDSRKPEKAEGPASTTVSLVGFQEPYSTSKSLPKSGPLIAIHIVEHCLEYFLQEGCPAIWLHDAQEPYEVLLNRLFKDELLASSQVTTIRVGSEPLNITHVHLKTKHGAGHKAFFCANDRVVVENRLVRHFPDLATRLTDAEGAEFAYAAYVKGTVLDGAVNQERTAFNLDEDSGPALKFQTTWDALWQSVSGAIEEHLKDNLAPVREEKRKVVEQYVQMKQPRFRQVLTLAPDVLALIKPNPTEAEMSAQLQRRHLEIEIELAKEGRELQSGISKAGKDGEYDAKMAAYMKKVTALNSDRLADYVKHRHTVLGILQDLLKLGAEGKHALEDELHNVIYPMLATSDETPEDHHNLWVIDERLAYHRYLASDKQLRANPLVTTKSAMEPDILIFDAAVAFGDSAGNGSHNVTLVEFKRPMRDDYDGNKNPVDQLFDYIEDIREGRAKREDGRQFALDPKSINFYGYAVCDITDKLKAVCRRRRLVEMMGGRGWCGYFEELRAWVEIVPYDAVIENAIRRNRVFFNKLGLPEVQD